MSRQEQPYPAKYSVPFILYPPSLWGNRMGHEFSQQYLDLQGPGEDYVLYISVPFCRVRCHSCPYFIDLLPTGDSKDKESRYVDAILADLRRWASYPRWQSGRLRSIYIGGGTGSVLSTHNLERLVSTIWDEFPVDEKCELTLEGNARDYTEDKLDYVAESPISRVSLGVQSFDPRMLKVIGSPHAAEASTQAIEGLTARGVTNIQADMMYNLPGHNREIWQSDLERLRELEIKHLTIYLYRIHDDTPQAKFIESGRVAPLLDKESSYVKNMYLDAIKVADDTGFRMYMFDHFAVPGYENVYNDWTFRRDAEVLGVGPGAYGFINRYRIGAKKDVDEYVATVGRGEHMVTSVSEQLTRRVRQERYVINVLQYFAVEFAEYGRRFGSTFLDDFRPTVRRLLGKGLVEVDDSRLTLTDHGKDWHMNVMLEFTNEKFWSDDARREHPHWSMNLPMLDLFVGKRELWLGAADADQPELADTPA